MRTVHKYLKLIFSIFFLAFYTGCGSSGGGGSDSGSTDPITTTVEHKFIFFNSCVAPCSTYNLFKYSLDDLTLSEVGAGIITQTDYDYGKYSKVLYSYQGKLYFSADDGTNGYELWVYDPSQPEAQGANPKMVDDIIPGSSGSSPLSFETLGGKIYFNANDGTNGRELWAYDPDQAVSSGQNPKMVYDLYAGSTGSDPSDILVFNGKLYMQARTASEGRELYVYDPTVAASATNPQLISDILPGVGGSSPSALTLLDSKIYFRATQGTNGVELWTYDPSLAVSGTNPKMVYDIRSGASGSNANYFEVLDSKIYFSANNGIAGAELWVYDPAVATSGTNPELVYDLVAGNSSSNPFDLEVHNGKLYYTASDGINGNEMLIFDPTQAASSSNPSYNDLLVGIAQGIPRNYTSFEEQLFLSYYDGSSYVFSIFDDSQAFLSGTNPSPHATILDDSIYDTTSLTYTETIIE